MVESMRRVVEVNCLLDLGRFEDFLDCLDERSREKTSRNKNDKSVSGIWAHNLLMSKFSAT